MNNDEILKIAKLARIKLNEDELEQYADLEEILNFVSQLNQVDTKDIEPMSHLHNHAQRLRPDKVTGTIDQQALQAVAPKNIEAGLYLVPEVFEE